MVAVTENRSDFAYINCNNCGNIFTIFYNREDMTDWLSGKLPIQNALYYLSANERELLLSGICGTCFSKLFSPLDNE